MKKVLKNVVRVLVLLVVLVIIRYAYVVLNLKEMNDEVRIAHQQDFVSLSQGTISYRWDGPEEGELVVLVHGFSTPRFVFMENVKALSKAGYRVLTYDHYGRGFSDRPKIAYTKKLYDQELLDLLNALGVEQPIHLLGYSMGGGIATTFATNHPERVKSLLLVAPVGIMPKPSGLPKLLMVPVLGEFVMTTFGELVLMNQFKTDVKENLAPSEMLEHIALQFEYKGFYEALVSTLRNYPMDDLRKEYRRLGELTIPKILIWGTADKVVPYQGSKEIVSLVPNLQLEAINEGRHTIVYSKKEAVNNAIIEFLAN